MQTIDMSQSTLENLSYLLKHKELWPSEFRWDYTHDHTCAYGLAQQFWGLEFQLPFRIPAHIYYGIEARVWYSPFRSMMYVKPHHVAKAIDEYLSLSH